MLLKKGMMISLTNINSHFVRVFMKLYGMLIPHSIVKRCTNNNSMEKILSVFNPLCKKANDRFVHSFVRYKFNYE